MAKNYYVILGVTADASREDIRAAFRRRALELHPDRSGLDSSPFQDLQEAYSVLGDPERRRRYDRDYKPLAAARSRGESPPEPLVERRSRGEPFRSVQPGRGFREVALAESFETYLPSFDELFERFWGNFEKASRPKAETLENLTVEVVLDPDEAAWGGHVRVWIPTRITCPACRGQGAVGAYECWQCEGHGTMTTESPVDVDYPAGLRDGHATKIPLARFGIKNLYLTVLFRVTREPGL
jgi:molecular chaperone DnaJ